MYTNVLRLYTLPLPNCTSHPTTGPPCNFIIVFVFEDSLYDLCVWVYKHVFVDAHEGLKRTSDPLELVLQGICEVLS